MTNSSPATSGKSPIPSVLEWARKQAAYEPEEVAKSLRVSLETVQAWEKGLGHPDIGILRQLSLLYDLPFAYFFFEVAPEEPLLKDYRGVPKERRTKLSRETRLALREFRRLIRLAQTLQEITGTFIPLDVGVADPHEAPEQVAEREAQRFGITRSVRQKWLTNDEAYHDWRKVIEALGIFVFSWPMSSLECRGAAIREEPHTAAIFVNQKDAPAARTFTLLHEYCHLLLESHRELIICDQFPGDTESFSNRFAASVLVPEDEFREILKDKELDRYQDWWPDTDLTGLARDFRVSRDVIAIRLENIEFAPSGFYRQKREHWNELFRGRGGFGPGKSKKAHAEEKLGSRLLKLMVNAVQTGILSPVDAALYIGEVRGGRRPWLVKVKDVESWIKEREKD